MSNEDVAETMDRMKKNQLESRRTRFYRDREPDAFFVSDVTEVSGSLERTLYRFARIDETRHGTHELDRIRTANIFESLLITLSDDSTASIRTSGLIGDKYISISRGGSERILAAGDEMTETESSVDLGTLIGKYAFGGV